MKTEFAGHKRAHGIGYVALAPRKGLQTPHIKLIIKKISLRSKYRI